MSLSSIVLNLIGIAVIVFIIMIIYKIIKGILEFFFYTAMDVKRFTDKVKDSKERKANIPIIVEDIIKSINSYCHDVDLIDYITVGSGHDDIYIKLTCCANLFRCICKLRKGKNPLLLLVGRLSAKR